MTLGFEDSRTQPAEYHRSVSPVLHVSRELSDTPIQILNRVRSAKGRKERPLDPEALECECLVESLAQRSCRAGMLLLQRPRQLLEATLRQLGILQVIRLLHRACDSVPQFVRQMAGYVSDLMKLTSLDCCQLTEAFLDRLANPLASIDYEQHGVIIGQAPIQEVP